MSHLDELNIFNLGTNSKVHFIGIGGISMSGLAEILLGRGVFVSGSDITESNITNRLKSLGAEIYIGQRASNIKPCDLIVYTAAIKEDNEEFAAARASGIKMVTRAKMLGEIMRAYKYAVAVSGTHGKTSTTSMVTHIMLKADTDPTVSIGGELPAIGGNIRVGKSDYFVCEACEYCESFLNFYPYIGIILNVDEDHLDYYKGINHIIRAFGGFAALPPKSGALVINSDDTNTLQAAKNANAKVITCSKENKGADYYAGEIEFDNGGFASYTLYERGKLLGIINLSVAGEHNILNSLCAIAATRYLGLSFAAIKAGVESFSGVDRRFQRKGEVCGGAQLIDDYAHHPTEIAATLKTALRLCTGTVWCVFQPHTYTRTKALYNEFVKVLSVDGVCPVLLDIYAAREKDTGLVSSAQLSDDIHGSVYMPDFESCADYLRKNVKRGDIVLTMGAGTVYRVGDILLCERRDDK